MAFLEMRSGLQDLVEHFGLLKSLDSNCFHASVERALDTIRAEPQ